MRIDYLLVTRPVARPRRMGGDRPRGSGRQAIPSDHAPPMIDLDEAGYPFDAGWGAAEARIAARLGLKR